MTEKLSVWKGTWSLIRYRPGYLALSVAMAVYVFTTRGVVGWLQKLFFDKLTNDAPVQFDFWTLLALIVAIEASRMINDVIGNWSAAKVRLAGQSLLRKNVVQNILHKPGAVPLPISSGDAVNRINHDLADFGDFPTWIPEIIGHFAFIILALIVMLRISVSITLVAVIPLFGIFFLNRFAWERFLRYNRESRESDSAVTSFLGEIFGGIQAVKAADAESAVMHFLQTLSQRRRVANVRHGTFFALFQSASDNMGDIAVALMVVMSGVALREGTFTIGDFSLFSTYLFFAARFPADLGSYISEIAQQRVVLDRTQEMHPLAAPERLIVHGPIYENGSLPLLKRPFLLPSDHLQTLQVSGLTQRFHTSAESRQSAASGIFDITFSMPRGSFTVITGRIGSGKTTLLRTLLGLLPAEAGEIIWNGRRVPNPATFFVPPRTAYTPQVPRLFSDSLRDNVLMGLPEEEVGLETPALSTVEVAVFTAALEQDITTLENGLDTIVGPRGVRLSGGQVQRTAAARMFVRNAELLVFDDLSSALDVETERVLWERLSVNGKQLSVIEIPNTDHRPPNTDHRLPITDHRLPTTDHRPPITDYHPTILAVSHRREALRRADQILVMENGRITAQGSLTELLKTSEDMQKLWHGHINGQGENK